MQSNELKFTKGPRKASELNYWVTAKGESITVCAFPDIDGDARGGSKVVDRDERRANARLIACCPDMFEALELIANHFDVSEGGEKAWEALALEMVDVARAAIAKATVNASEGVTND